MSTQHRKVRTAELSARWMRIAVVVSTYNRDVSDRLLQGAISCLKKHGATFSRVSVHRCPGAFELPQVAAVLAGQRRWDAIVCLGAVIRGETPHFDFVAAEAARGIQTVALKSRLPVAFGVLTTENRRQALDRSGGKHGNKGWEAALTAMEMAELYRDLKHRRKRKPA